MMERQMEIDARRRMQELSELERKARKSHRRSALQGTMTMEEYDYEFVKVMSLFTAALCGGDGECAPEKEG